MGLFSLAGVVKSMGLHVEVIDLRRHPLSDRQLIERIRLSRATVIGLTSLLLAGLKPSLSPTCLRVVSLKRRSSREAFTFPSAPTTLLPTFTASISSSGVRRKELSESCFHYYWKAVTGQSWKGSPSSIQDQVWKQLPRPED